MGNHFVCCLAYADDLTLLAPTRKALQVMVNVVRAILLNTVSYSMTVTVSFLYLKVPDVIATNVVLL